ncbi:MAG: PilZ domain-containing protein [Treponema sp.]|nr:PilZ domain-containing protein [Treponema sp.]
MGRILAGIPLTEMPLRLLQSPSVTDFQLKDDPMQTVILLIGVAVLVIVITVVKLLRRVSPSIAGKARNNIRAPLSPRKFSFLTLRRIASSYGLNREQTKLLEYIFRNDEIADPERVMRNPALVDQHFKRAYRKIERSSETEEEAQTRFAKLFSLRDIIDLGAHTDSDAPVKLSENTPAILMVGNESYPVKVIKSQGKNVVVEAPRNALGTPIRVAKDMSVTLSFFTRSSEGFSLAGNAVGSSDTPRGAGLEIQHLGKLKPLAKRMYRRKKVSIRADISMVFLEGSKKKKDQKLVVDPRKSLGTILDISKGGCALKVSAAIPVGSRLKISMFFNEKHPIHVVGQVLRINKSGTVGTILHIKFLKVPLWAFNSISALVYGYNDSWD